MHLSPSRTFLTATALLSTVLGVGIASVSAEDAASNEMSCDQITAIMKTVRPGTMSYQRMKDQYNRRCLVIKSGCPSQARMDAQMKACKDAGMYGIPYIDPSSCKQIRCSENPPSSSSSSAFSESSSVASQTGPCMNGAALTKLALACDSKNLRHEEYTLNGCKMVRCIEDVTAQRTTCPSVSTLTNKVRSCKSLGRDAEYYTIGVCRMVRCTNEGIDGNVVSCMDDAAINLAATRCKMRSQRANITSDADGCRHVQCKPMASSATSSCPSDDALDAGITACKNSGMTGTTMPDDHGCRQVICQPLRGAASSRSR